MHIYDISIIVNLYDLFYRAEVPARSRRWLDDVAIISAITELQRSLISLDFRATFQEAIENAA